MKQKTTKALLLSMMAAAVVSCANDSEFDSVAGGNPSQQPFTVEIEASQGVEESTTRASYGEMGDFSWTAGDKFMMAYRADFNLDGTRSYNEYNGSYFSEFTTQESAKSAYFSGEVMPFVGDTTIYACYKGDQESLDQIQYNVDWDRNVLNVRSWDLANWCTPSATATISGGSMGCMVATANGASVESVDKFNIPALNFKQVASFFQVEVTGHPAGLTIDYVSLMPTRLVQHYINTGDDLDTSKTFVEEAEIDWATGAISKVVANDDSVGVEIRSDYDRNNCFFTIPLLPSKTSEPTEELTLMLDVEGEDGSYYVYYYDLGTGINFKRNTIHRKSGLKWSDFTKYTYSAVIPLSKFDAPSYVPTEVEWIIDTEADTDLSAADLAGVRRALCDPSLAAGSIEISFTSLANLTSLGAEAFKGDLPALASVWIETGNSITIGDAAFAGNTNLDDVYVEGIYNDDDQTSTGGDVTLGEGVFEGCPGLSSVGVNVTSYPARTFKNCTSLRWFNSTVPSIGESAFENCTSLGVNDYDDGSGIPSIPDLNLYGVQSIGARAFYNCNQFGRIDIYTNGDTSLQSLGAEAFNYDSVDGSISYTPNAELYVDSHLQGNVNYRTLTIGGVSYEFAKIFVDGVEQTEGGSGGDVVVDPQPSTGDDADVDIL